MADVRGGESRLVHVAKEMARKLKVYGKKKGQDIVSAFERLTLLLPSDRDTNHNESRDALSPKSHNIRQQRRPHEKETREDLKLQENQQIQTQDALIPFADSPIQSDHKEASEVSLPPVNRTREDHRRHSPGLDGFVGHNASPLGGRRSHSRDDQAERLEKTNVALEEPAPIEKEKQGEAIPSEQNNASVSKAIRSASLRNAARVRKEQPWKSGLALNETGVELKGKTKPLVAHGAPEKSSIVQSKAISPQNSTPEGNSGIAPPRTLRSTRLGRSAADPAPVRKLALDQKTVEHLKPLTELESVTGTRDIQLWHAEWTDLCTISKIAEGSYGSVFKMSDKKRSQAETIGKLMPLKAKSGVGSKKTSNTTIEAAVSEVKLLELMSDVPGFVMFRNAEILIGGLPRALRDEYRAFTTKEKGSSCGISEGETWYPNHQAWLFIEMDNAGVELDHALTGDANGSGLLQVSMTGQRFLTVKRTRDIFWGVVEALMRGEQIHGFEHRDLHLSNICVEVNMGKQLDSGYELIPPATNVNVTIIDYTLSRATMPDNSPIFNPMTDGGIFEGDGTVDLQFDIYRHMRELVANPKAANKGWDAYVPITNVLWLSHLLTKLMQWTPRPEEIRKEQELWQSLNALKLVIDLDYRWSWDLLSACDVARYMQVGKKEFLGRDQGTEGGKGRGRRRCDEVYQRSA